MCAISGRVTATAHDDRDILRMMRTMRHRGPDSHGLWADGKLQRTRRLSDLEQPGRRSRRVIAHSRLAIVDKSCVGQPYASCDGTLHLVHNGEVYNYTELGSLLLRDHRSRGESDSEVVAHLLEESYDGQLAKAVEAVAPILDGMVTMAVTDGRDVVVSRDVIGKKPVYYSPSSDGTRFASERKALPNPRRLEPGHLLRLRGAERELREFDRVRLPPIDVIDFEDAVALYRRVFTNAVRKRLVGLEESAVGVIFSGGIDSVLVAKQLRNAGVPVRCYCVGTVDSGDVQAAEEAARTLGVDVRVRVISRQEIERRLPEIIYAVEESGQLQVEVAIPMYLASEMAAEEGIRVVFTGQGADETQGGYDWYRSVVPDGAIALHRRMWEDFRRLYDETLEREDKLTMAHSLEQRAPYLDRELVGESMRISPILKVRDEHDRMRKWVHRRVAVDLGVPEGLAFRTKDPSQTGSGIHGIVEAIAKEKCLAPDLERVRRNCAADKGNLFRYRNLTPETYGSPEARSLLESLAEEVATEPVGA